MLHATVVVDLDRINQFMEAFMFTQPSTTLVFKITKNYYSAIQNMKNWADITDRLNGNKLCPLKWHILFLSKEVS